MKTIARTFKVYKFSELSEQAKENARWQYLREMRTTDELHDLFLEDLNFNLGIKCDYVAFCLGHVQGDFVKIHADIPEKRKKEIEREYAQWGYAYFDEVDDTEIETDAEYFNWVFDENGNFESEEKAWRRLK